MEKVSIWTWGSEARPSEGGSSAQAWALLSPSTAHSAPVSPGGVVAPRSPAGSLPPADWLSGRRQACIQSTGTAGLEDSHSVLTGVSVCALQGPVDAPPLDA